MCLPHLFIADHHIGEIADALGAAGPLDLVPLVQVRRPGRVPGLPDPEARIEIDDRQVAAEVLQELKRRLPDLPVIVLTAEPRASERQRAEELGADAFLSKPFSPIELLETIERLLGVS